MNYKAVAALAFTSMFSISTLLSPAYAQEQEKALNFGIISTESQQNLKPQWEPFLKDMETKLGIKVNAFFAPDYAGIIQGMRFNKVDIAWYGNLSAMEAVDRANGQVFAQTVAADGSPGYWSVLIVNKDSPINNLNDMLAKRKELTFGNGDPNSTSGFLVPGYYVFAKNNASASDFKRTVNASHETNAPGRGEQAGGCCHQQHRKPRQAENLRAGQAERTEGDLEIAADPGRPDRLA